MKKIGLFVMTSLAILLAVTPAEAATWEFIAGTKNIRAFVDTESVSGSADGPKEGWIKYELVKPNCTVVAAKNKNKCIATMISYVREEKNRTYCELQQNYYFTDNTDTSAKLTCKSKRILPGSLGEKIWKYFYPAPPPEPAKPAPPPQEQEKPSPPPEPPVREPSSGTDSTTEP